MENQQIKSWYEKKHEKTFNCFETSHTKEAEVRDTFQRVRKSDTILHFLNVEMLLPIHQNQIYSLT